MSHSDVTVMRWASRPASSTPAYDVAHKEWWLPEPLRCNGHASAGNSTGELDPGAAQTQERPDARRAAALSFEAIGKALGTFAPDEKDA